jgi:hypothetical protein
MVAPRGAAVPARTELLRAIRRALATLALVVLIAPGLASQDHMRDPTDLSDWSVEQMAFRFAIFQQEGRGLQSQAEIDRTAGAPIQRGSEHAWIFQPMISALIRQDRDTTHSLTLPIDIVTAASPDALNPDVQTNASRENEAAGLDLVTTVRDSEDVSWQLHIGFHFEEYWGNGQIGGAFIHRFADDNATLRLGIETIFDSFDPLQPDGIDPGPVVNRFGTAATGSISQLLSPTTIAMASYTFTAQFGVLETTYNSVPVVGGGRLGDRYPRTRGRHTLTGEIRQAIPETDTYLALSYRFYADTFGALAHSSQLTATQYIGDLWVRGHYRFHHQDAPSFWMSSAPTLDAPEWLLRTSDSDLETLDAHEGGLDVRWFFDRRGALTAQSSYVQLGYVVYGRSTGLVMHVGSFDFGFGF